MPPTGKAKLKTPDRIRRSRVVDRPRTEQSQEVLNSIGQQLLKIRKEKDLSLVEMCVATKRSNPSWFSAIEKGQENLTIETLVDVATALGKTLVVKLV